MNSVHLRTLAFVGILGILIAISFVYVQRPDTSLDTASRADENQQSLSLPAIADARVKSSSPRSKYGTSSYLRTRNTQREVYSSYMRFVVPDTSQGGIRKATLRLFAYDTCRDGGVVHATANEWQEDSITWESAPPAGALVTSHTKPVAKNTWVEYDVTQAVQSPGEYSFVLSSDDSDSCYFRARESSQNKPELVVEFQTQPTTAPTGLSQYSCTDASQCVRGLDAGVSACEHVCQGAECTGAPLCTVMHRAEAESAPQIQCIRSVPCRMPDQVSCVDGACVGSVSDSGQAVSGMDCSGMTWSTQPRNEITGCTFAQGMSSCGSSDINDDGKVDAGDLSALSVCNGNNTAFDGCRFADRNKDGSINDVDAAEIRGCVFASAGTCQNRDINQDMKINAGDLSANTVCMNHYSDEITLSLKRGTTNVSVPFSMASMQPTFVFQDLIRQNATFSIFEATYEGITARWNTYAHARPINTLTALTPGKGVRIQVDRDVEVRLRGSYGGGQLSYRDLQEGWNEVGILGTQPVPVRTLFSESELANMAIEANRPGYDSNSADHRLHREGDWQQQEYLLQFTELHPGVSYFILRGKADGTPHVPDGPWTQQSFQQE